MLNPMEANTWGRSAKVAENVCPLCDKAFGKPMWKGEGWVAWDCQLNVMGEGGVEGHGCGNLFVSVPDGGKFGTIFKAESADGKTKAKIAELAAAFLVKRARDKHYVAKRKADDLEAARIFSIGTRKTCINPGCPAAWSEVPPYVQVWKCPTCLGTAFEKRSDQVRPYQAPASLRTETRKVIGK